MSKENVFFITPLLLQNPYRHHQKLFTATTKNYSLKKKPITVTNISLHSDKRNYSVKHCKLTITKAGKDMNNGGVGIANILKSFSSNTTGFTIGLFFSCFHTQLVILSWNFE